VSEKAWVDRQVRRLLVAPGLHLGPLEKIMREHARRHR
jgi:hypothetical protein